MSVCFIQNFQQDFSLVQFTIVSYFFPYSFENFSKGALSKAFILPKKQKQKSQNLRLKEKISQAFQAMWKTIKHVKIFLKKTLIQEGCFGARHYWALSCLEVGERMCNLFAWVVGACACYSCKWSCMQVVCRRSLRWGCIHGCTHPPLLEPSPLPCPH